MEESMNAGTGIPCVSWEECSVTPTPLLLSDVLTVLFDVCSNGTLASSAQVCKSWSTHALRHLWRELENPLPLLQLLGPVQRRRHWGGIFYDPHTPLSLENLPRIQFYGQFIRSITIRTGTREEWIDPSCISDFVLMVQLLHRPVLPYLSKLECVTLGAASTTIGFWLNFCPTELKLTFEKPQGTACFPVVQSLRHYGAFLTSLDLEFRDIETDLPDVKQCVADTLKSLCNLAQISADGAIICSPSVWVCLAQLPKLEQVLSRRDMDLSNFIGEVGPSDWLELPDLVAPFPSLHNLEVVAPCWLATMILTEYPLDHLRSLALLLQDAPDDSGDEFSVHVRLPQAISRFKDLMTLMLVTPQWSFPILDLHLPLDFKVLSICTMDSGSIGNDDFRDLCAAVPNLESLTLIPSYIGRNDKSPRLTLEAIRLIGDVCPRLKWATLYVDTGVSSFQWSHEDTPFPSHLADLFFLGTPIEDYFEVAAYLCTLFPDPEDTPNIGTTTPDFSCHFDWEGPVYVLDEDCGFSWDEVVDAMDMLRKRIIPSFRKRLEAKDAEIVKVREELRRALAGSLSGEGLDC